MTIRRTRTNIRTESPDGPSTISPATGFRGRLTGAFAVARLPRVPPTTRSVRVKSSQLNRLMDMLAELVMLRNRRETELSDLQEVYHELIGSVSKMRLLSNEGNRRITDASSSLQLSEIANDVLEVAQHVRDCARPVAEGNTAVSQFIRQFRQELVELRRTPVSGLFRRLQRVVRDAAQAESKEVQSASCRARTPGSNARCNNGCTNRCCTSSAIPSATASRRPNNERKSGKPPAGTITLEAKSGPDLFVIEIRDDGRGLDYDAIRRRGVESGLLASDQAASREELSQLIFQPGFSTRQTANQVAGRGVGMDVVASTLQRMRGWLEVDSEPDQGTRIRLSFPLALGDPARDGLSLGRSIVRPADAVGAERGRSRDRLESACVFGNCSEPRSHQSETSQRIVLACDSRSAIGGDDPSVSRCLVDEIVGPEEVVVRPLPTLLQAASVLLRSDRFREWDRRCSSLMPGELVETTPASSRSRRSALRRNWSERTPTHVGCRSARVCWSLTTRSVPANASCDHCDAIRSISSRPSDGKEGTGDSQDNNDSPPSSATWKCLMSTAWNCWRSQLDGPP